MANFEYIIGVDEAGRGSLGGPVTAGAVLLPAYLKLKKSSPASGFRDSKKYTPKQREEWLKFVDNHSDISFEFSSVWQRVIDKTDIKRATDLAATRATERLIKRNGVNPEKTKIILDGSLNLRSNELNYEVIIKGDEKERAIQIASTVAKFKRDKAMERVARKHEEYRFENHKGYGTEEHRRMIKKHGPCEYHRRSFLENLNV